jgi:hypothetical protein
MYQLGDLRGEARVHIRHVILERVESVALEVALQTVLCQQLQPLDAVSVCECV